MGRLPEKNSLVDIFRWRVEESSNLIVSKFNNRELTYSEFDSNANPYEICEERIIKIISKAI